jgi:sodium/potassium-transporting ATPase subunit beta
VDKDNLLDVTFYPPTGFPFYFYPYLAQPNYMPPFVMAQFNVIHGRAMMIWCRNWAKGIKQDRTDVQGGIHFELLVDPPVKVVINS